jgi:hypothetical protein
MKRVRFKRLAPISSLTALADWTAGAHVNLMDIHEQERIHPSFSASFFAASHARKNQNFFICPLTALVFELILSKIF